MSGRYTDCARDRPTAPATGPGAAIRRCPPRPESRRVRRLPRPGAPYPAHHMEAGDRPYGGPVSFRPLEPPTDGERLPRRDRAPRHRLSALVVGEHTHGRPAADLRRHGGFAIGLGARDPAVVVPAKHHAPTALRTSPRLERALEVGPALRRYRPEDQTARTVRERGASTGSSGGPQSHAGSARAFPPKRSRPEGDHP